MKTLKTLTIALTAAAALTTVATAQTLSPRAEANKTRVASGSTEDLGRSTALGSPRGLANATRIAPAPAHEGDTLAAIRNSRLSPRAQTQRGGADFQVAVLGTADAKSCSEACCKK
jgi:hypothetical protein